MNTKALKEKMDQFFRETPADKLMDQFKELGYTFEKIEEKSGWEVLSYIHLALSVGLCKPIVLTDKTSKYFEIAKDKPDEYGIFSVLRHTDGEIISVGDWMDNNNGVGLPEQIKSITFRKAENDIWLSVDSGGIILEYAKKVSCPEIDTKEELIDIIQFLRDEANFNLCQTKSIHQVREISAYDTVLGILNTDPTTIFGIRNRQAKLKVND